MDETLVRTPRWVPDRPRTLVVACSDGRLQKGVDDFLHHRFGLTDYDRLYVPGGAGALAASGMEFSRATRFRRECSFLIEAHQVERLILLFHGPSENGPPETVCADYRRKEPQASPAEIRALQVRDADEILKSGLGQVDAVQIHVYRCEVEASHELHFVLLREA